MKKRSSSFTVIGLLFVVIGISLVDDNKFLRYGFLLLGMAFLFYSIFTMFKKR
ncbi:MULTISPECIES: hypothetical protein [Chryseobacterium]|uniref:Phosphatidate cytidylyltransferase n=2 Tax=Chryseobacterium TaxID=59732 RepID=A0ABT3XYP7_9FLAO|nr:MULTISPECIES: hypothetical protein [Chryseobacterium]MCX8524488.1 hypothetical protein [Chryseobacterium formosus]MCX8531023.1 hypothetical protein [Chryseobacterium luquanense]